MKKLFSSIFGIIGLLFSSFEVISQDAQTIRGEAIIRVESHCDMTAFESRMISAFGISGGFGVSRCLIAEMDIWLVRFNQETMQLDEALYVLRNDPDVIVAQANHRIEERIIPDDPLFELQWHHEQSSDHDIDTPQAWDITTGGVNALGHDVVVCVVEIGGTRWNTSDIEENHWVNVNEIPDNGMDDDDNGYVDDYDGWNVSTGDDNLGTGDHGTRVSSMIGSRGNNTLGVTGVNWNVKMMQVQISGSSEAAAIEGYAYPLAMRRLYNQTGGAEGAFVVATNSSWGTDGGQADEAPLWCAMYDSLGSEGVLSCGSTTNNNVDVDEVGDLPTGCPSDYLISVARTNSQDIRAGGGFGLTTIDLAAPGDAVYLANNNSFGNTTGTSFSSPCVAGAIALIYSAPCTSLAEQSISSPAYTALQMKESILSGVDTTSQLLSELLSGGRLNVWNSMQQVLSQCDNSLCSMPFGVTIDQASGSTYAVSWSSSSSALSYGLRYRLVGDNNWIMNYSDASSDTLNDLSFCAEYEVQVMSFCEGDSSQWSNAVNFLTDGCCENPDDVFVNSNMGQSVTLEWSPVLSASGYNVVVMDSMGNEVLGLTTAESLVSLTGLENCTQYNAYIYSVCTGFPPPPPSFTFLTGGCSDCASVEVCSASASSSEEYIQFVGLSSIQRESASDNGYVFVEDQSAELIRGESYTVTLAPGFASGQYNENFRVWIDFNSDGDFEELDELAFDAPQPTQEQITGTITVPVSSVLGSVRMRVGMAYTPITSAQEPEACGVWNFGEVEDYCVTIVADVSMENIRGEEDILFPVPADDFLFCRQTITSVECYDASGRSYSLPISTMNGMTAWDVSSLSSGIYVVVFDLNGERLSKSFIISR